MQEEIYLPELTTHQRRDALEANAQKIETTKYQKPLTPEKLTEKREIVTDNAIKLSVLDDELATVKKDFKGKMDPLKIENKSLLQEIKTKQETVEGALYHLPNFDSGWMETYNEDGELINKRKLCPDEKQGVVFPLKKAQ